MNLFARTVLSKRVITKKNFSDKFLNDLLQQPWDLISIESNPAALWDAWKTLFMDIVDKHAPLKTKQISKNILRGFHMT